MKVVVCVKEIPDPDIAASVFSVDEAARRVVALPGMRRVMSPFDAQAIEVALRLRDARPDTAITLVTLGDESARAVVKQGLALGADEAFLLADPAFDGGDSHTTARALAAAIAKIGGVDLILAGRQAADGDRGVVGCVIAERLDMPVVTLAAAVTVEGALVVIERALGDGAETVEVALPAVVTVSHEVGAVRHASLRETMKAARKPITEWTAEDLCVAPSELAARSVLERLHVPASGVTCEFLTGASPEELATDLVERLTAARLVEVHSTR